MKCKIVPIIIFSLLLFQSCIYGGMEAEEQVEKLQKKLDRIRNLAEDFSIGEDIDSVEYDRIQNLLWEIEDECEYEDFKFYIPD